MMLSLALVSSVSVSDVNVAVHHNAGRRWQSRWV
jgi:hypothetical protein